MNIVAIIGTAGRGNDAKKLNETVYHEMLSIAEQLLRKVEQPYTVISGGAAWADHVAVSLFLQGKVLKLRLYLPCEFDLVKRRFVDDGTIDWKVNPGGTANHYHDLFSNKLSKDTLGEIGNAIEDGAEVIAGGGMLGRNVKVARDATHVISFTFGDKEFLKDGGTANTMATYLKERKNANLLDNSYHVDLNTMRIYKGARVV
jgi:hypothetical protein